MKLEARKNQTKIGVIIVTHNRVTMLRLTLLSLLRQITKPHEILILDDSSDVKVSAYIRDILSKLQQEGVLVKLYRSRKELGLGASRSILSHKSDSDVLVYIDDDVILNRNFIEVYLRIFKNADECDIIGGPCLPLYVGFKSYRLPKWWNEEVLGHIVSTRNDVLRYSLSKPQPMNYIFGCNMAIRREVISNLKGFKPWLGRVKKTFLSGEDWDLVRRALLKGFKACFCQRAVAYHIITPHKLQFSKILRKGVDTAATRCMLLSEGVYGGSYFKVLLRYLLGLLKDLVELSINLLRPDLSKMVSELYNLVVHMSFIFSCRKLLKEYRRAML